MGFKLTEGIMNRNRAVRHVERAAEELSVSLGYNFSDEVTDEIKNVIHVLARIQSLINK